MKRVSVVFDLFEKPQSSGGFVFDSFFGKNYEGAAKAAGGFGGVVGEPLSGFEGRRMFLTG